MAGDLPNYIFFVLFCFEFYTRSTTPNRLHLLILVMVTKKTNTPKTDRRRKDSRSKSLGYYLPRPSLSPSLSSDDGTGVRVGEFNRSGKRTGTHDVQLPISVTLVG